VNSLVDVANPAGDETGSDATGVRILRLLLRGFSGSVAFRFGNGVDHIVGDDKPEFTFVVRDPAVLRSLILRGGTLALAEAYFRGRIDFEGNLYAALELRRHFQALRLGLGQRLTLLREILRLPRRERAEELSVRPDAGGPARDFAHRHSRGSDRAAIAFHYDASNRFYGLWLDRQMVYSCAYFETEADNLDQAQSNKLDHVCRKLRLSRGERLLDIGCGWGGLICWAARHYGVQAHGITLSQQQLEYAREHIAANGLQDRVSVELRDYRDLAHDSSYDKVASIGMVEHVGLANLAGYFNAVSGAVRPGGLFLSQGITRDVEGWKKSQETEFINRYVFPDAEIDTVANMQRSMERAGFEIHDVEGLRAHYALTLRKWVQRLEAAQDEALQEVGELRYRIWRLYMTACAQQFEEGATGVYQILASRRAGVPASIPLTRCDLYVQTASTPFARDDHAKIQEATASKFMNASPLPLPGSARAWLPLPQANPGRARGNAQPPFADPRCWSRPFRRA
jgi:cyclopropane-fatty-acyl-phospholipid synthase